MEDFQIPETSSQPKAFHHPIPEASEAETTKAHNIICIMERVLQYGFCIMKCARTFWLLVVVCF